MLYQIIAALDSAAPWRTVCSPGESTAPATIDSYSHDSSGRRAPATANLLYPHIGTRLAPTFGNGRTTLLYSDHQIHRLPNHTWRPTPPARQSPPPDCRRTASNILPLPGLTPCLARFRLSRHASAVVVPLPKFRNPPPPCLPCCMLYAQRCHSYSSPPPKVLRQFLSKA